MESEEVKGISIFLNANIDQDGMEKALSAQKRRIVDDKILKNLANNKTFRYYGGSMHQVIKFKNLHTILGWNSSMNYVEYKNKSCGEVMIVGHGAQNILKNYF